MLPALTILSGLVFVLYIYCCVSDWWDGHLARYRQVDDDPYGKRLDELADKGMMVLTLIVLAYTDGAPINGWAFWAIVTIMARDLGVTYLRSRDKVWADNLKTLPLAKAKTGLLMVGCGLLLFGEPFMVVGLWIIALAVVCALVSGVQYYLGFPQKWIKTRQKRGARY